MKEILIMNFGERVARKFFRKDEGKVLGLGDVRRISLDMSTARYREIEQLARRYGPDKFFFAGWDIIRKYSDAELAEVELFEFAIRPMFEPSGEACGTIYQGECPLCGAGGRQTTPLFLQRSRIPKDKDFCVSVARNEDIVSRRVVDLFRAAGVTGVTFGPVIFGRYTNSPAEDWFQLIVDEAAAEFSTTTKFGNDPFDDDPRNEHRCTYGHTAGLNIISEAVLNRATVGETDFVQSRQYVGIRGGDVRPDRLTFISQKVRNLIVREKLKGAVLRVARLA
jgi:hypothetical protein